MDVACGILLCIHAYGRLLILLSCLLASFLKNVFLELIIPNRSILHGYSIPILRYNRYK